VLGVFAKLVRDYRYNEEFMYSVKDERYVEMCGEPGDHPGEIRATEW
jgi:hypothetical protein